MCPSVADSDGLTGETIRAWRTAAGLTVEEAARELRNLAPEGMPDLQSVVRSWKRWERGVRPSRMYRPLLKALVAQVAAEVAAGASVELGGDWWASWQTWRDDDERVNTQRVGVRQRGRELEWWAATRGVEVANGGFLWRGELLLFDNQILVGWYAAEDGAVLSKGSVYMRLHPHGQVVEGRWMGLSHDGPFMSGWGVLARQREQAVASMRRLIEEERRGTDRER